MRYPVLALLSGARPTATRSSAGWRSASARVDRAAQRGQVYMTLQRLTRDELVGDDAAPQDGRPDKRVYRLTDAGRRRARGVGRRRQRPTRLRDDFFMKLVFAARLGLADPAELIARQRAAYLRTLGELERVLADGDDDADDALVVEGAALHLEADLKWLDRCEAVADGREHVTAVVEASGLGKVHGRARRR
jgi:hypothetical protein